MRASSRRTWGGLKLLELKHVTAHYGKLQALRDVSLEVGEGQIVCLIGANGAGKSTLLKVISGYVPLTAGEVLYRRQRIHGTRADRLVPLGICRVPEGRKIFPQMTVTENLELGAYTRTDRTRIDEDMQWVFDTFPRLLERRSQLAGTLSGGEQQMVAIGRGMMADPKLFLLDEPSLGLAPLLVREIARVVKMINEKGTTVLLVEQNAEIALRLADRAYVMEAGAIVRQGTASEIMKDDYVKTAYLGQ